MDGGEWWNIKNGEEGVSPFQQSTAPHTGRSSHYLLRIRVEKLTDIRKTSNLRELSFEFGWTAGIQWQTSEFRCGKSTYEKSALIKIQVLHPKEEHYFFFCGLFNIILCIRLYSSFHLYGWSCKDYNLRHSFLLYKPIFNLILLLSISKYLQLVCVCVRVCARARVWAGGGGSAVCTLRKEHHTFQNPYLNFRNKGQMRK